MTGFLRRNKIIIIFSAAYIILLILHRFIYLMGDDFYYGSFASGGLGDFIEMHAQHYLRVNGRALVHFIVSALLVFGVYLWRVINPAVILLTLYFIYKIAFKNQKKRGESPESLIIIILLFFLFGADVLRQGVYWLDGSVNYLYPMLMVFLSYDLYINPPAKTRLRYAVFFISGATTEQAGLILFGLFFIDALHCGLILKTKINKSKIFALLFVLSGYLTVILAPGTFERLKIHGTPFNPGALAGSVMYIANLTFFNGAVIYIHVILLLVCFFYLYKRGRVLDKIFGALCPVLVLFYIIASNAGISRIDIKYTAVFIIFYVFILLYAYINMFLDDKTDITDLSFIITAFGAQLMLAASGVFGERTLLSSVLCLIVPAIRGLAGYKNRHILFIFAAAAFFLPATIYKTLIFVPFAVFKIIKPQVRLDILPLLVLGALIFAQTTAGYCRNSAVHEHNISAAKNYSDGIIILKKAGEDYCVSPLHESPYHLHRFRIYYNIPPDVIIFFEE